MTIDEKTLAEVEIALNEACSPTSSREGLQAAFKCSIALIAALREAWRERDALKTEADASNSTRLGARVAELETALREIADFGKCEPVLYGNDEWFVNIARRAIGEGES